MKSKDSKQKILEKIKTDAIRIYSIKKVVEKYMESIEEIININQLHKCFKLAVKDGYTDEIFNEIILQSKVEFNY